MMAARYLESDDDLRAIVEYLQRHTPLHLLNFVEAREVFRGLSHLGYVIQKPAPDPARNNEPPINYVVFAPFKTKWSLSELERKSQ
jgi:hypothetical protein